MIKGRVKKENRTDPSNIPIVNPTAKAAITPFVEYQQKIRNGELPAGGVSPANTTMNT